MPKKNAHGTQAGQQTETEKYKVLTNYKSLALINDDISRGIKSIYDNNYWNLKEHFIDLKDYYQQVGISTEIAWENDIQYLDVVSNIDLNVLSLSAFKQGDYRADAIDNKNRPNSIKTESDYAKRIEFFAKTFPVFHQFRGEDNFSWILTNNRLLTYEILNYHNQKENTIATLNNDFKTLIRAIKLLLVNPDSEIRWKFSALQIALGDIDRFNDDLNLIKTQRELNTFIPYEQLLDLVDTLEKRYYDELNKLPDNVKNDGKLHSNHIFQLHQILLAVAINVWDYPSRLDKYNMEFVVNKDDIQQGKNYILLDNTVSFIFNNEKKKHKPLEYKLNAKPIAGFNKRLNELIIYSFSKYPRKYLFIQANSWKNQELLPVKDTTITNWIIDLIPHKHLGVGTFRSSFVSYYYNKSNNRQKEIMKIRMRTSRGELERAYFKFYTSPEQLVQVKVEPSDELVNRANSGLPNNPIIVNDRNIQQQQHYEPRQIAVNLPQPRDQNITLQERRRINAKKWYADPKNKEKHLKKVNEDGKNPEKIRKRYLRELSNGLLEWDRIKNSTKEKYNLNIDNDGRYS